MFVDEKDIGVNLFNGFKKLKPLNKIGVSFRPTWV
jgi:hypothetical protein